MSGISTYNAPFIFSAIVFAISSTFAIIIPSFCVTSPLCDFSIMLFSLISLTLEPFNPTPSISAMLMNMYKIKQTCKNYNLAGMGCSSGLVSIDLARDLLNVYSG